jgi:ATP-dependent RNA helicase SUPV3L1/SUV3
LAGSIGFELFMSDYPGLAPTMSVLPRLHPRSMPHQAKNPNAAAIAPSLPNARHASRVPAHITKEDLGRIRQAAYVLPQVVKPADYVPEGSPGFEMHLDKLGLVLLQKSVPGARPSRWIEPALMDAALAQLQAVPPGPEVRALMQTRTAALEALGVARRAGVWTRLVRQTLALSPPDWRVPVLFHAVLDAATQAGIWAYYRQGDEAACARPWAHRRPSPSHRDPGPPGSAGRPQPATSRPTTCRPLLPRLQAECAAPQAAARFEGRLHRAQDRWEHYAPRLDKLQGLNSELAFQGYPDTFEKARRLQRSVTLYVGPPNSGKTHAAFERLAQALDGAYLAPLRLLALEGRDRLVARGVPCSAAHRRRERAGRRRARGQQHHRDGQHQQGHRRGGDRRSADDLRQLARLGLDAGHRGGAGQRGDHHLQRLRGGRRSRTCWACAASAARCATSNASSTCSCCRARCRWPTLKLGDAVVAFSRRDVLMLRDQIAASGHPVSVIYGALPPEVRRREAERFATGEPHPGGHRRHRHGPEPADPACAVQHHGQVRRPGRPRR